MAMVVCWFLGLGSLVSWNSMLTIEDYYYQLFPVSFLEFVHLLSFLNFKFFSKWSKLMNFYNNALLVDQFFFVDCIYSITPIDILSFFALKLYHPSRVLTLVYQPFALGTMAILAYNEAKIDTRKRNLTGYILFFLSTLALLVVSIASPQFLHNLWVFHFHYHYRFLCKFMYIVLSLSTAGFSHIRERWDWKLYRYMSNCRFFWGSRCPRSRWNGWRLIFYAPRVHPSELLLQKKISM